MLGPYKDPTPRFHFPASERSLPRVALIVVGLAWLFGIASVALWDVPPWAAGAWIAVLAPITWAKLGTRATGWVVVAAVLAVVGAWRFDSWASQAPPDLARYVGQEVTLDGAIDSEPDPGLTTNSYTFVVRTVRTAGEPGRPTTGSVRISVSQFKAYPPGTSATVRGKLDDPPVFDDFDYRGFLARRGIVATMFARDVKVTSVSRRFDLHHPILSFRRDIADLRVALDRSLARSLPEPEASLAAGFVFGRDGNLPDDVYQDFRDTGLAHLVAVSGTNVTLVAAVAFALVTPWLGRKRATLVAAMLVAAYVLAAGASPSVLRAGTMAAVYLLGAALGRQRSSLTALSVAAIVMTAVSPATAMDVGFQLSLAATAGIIVFASWIDVALVRLRVGAVLPSPVVVTMAMTLASTVATLPIIWVTFGRISLVSLLANLLVEPLFVAAFVLSGASAVAGVIWQPVGQPIGWALGVIAYYPLAGIAWTASVLADVPLAAVDLPGVNGDTEFIALVALCAAAWPAYRHLPPDRAFPEPGMVARRVRVGAVVAGGVAFGVTVAFVSLLPWRGPGELEMTALDVGQGDAILVTTPHGRHFVVDGGPSGIQLARELGATLPHWERRIDAVFLTHPQQDHIAGFPELFDRFRAANTYVSGSTNPTEAYRIFAAEAPRLQTLQSGDRLEIDGVLIEVLWPPVGYQSTNLNDTSLILRIRYGETTFLLTGDFEAPAQKQLMATTNVAASVLKVPHHGSKTTAPEFLNAVGAQIAVISVGTGNRFGHPSPETLEVLKGTPVYRTDTQGRITVSSNGHRVTVRTGRR